MSQEDDRSEVSTEAETLTLEKLAQINKTFRATRRDKAKCEW